LSSTTNLEQYRTEREEIAKLFQSEGGKALLRRLRRQWDVDELLGDTPEKTAYNVGKRDALRDVETLADYERK